jgi:uncharacterized protein (PEP-CTERM system associated)
MATIRHRRVADGLRQVLPRRRLRLAGGGVIAALALALPTPATAQYSGLPSAASADVPGAAATGRSTWLVRPTLGAEIVWTDNVDLAPPGQQRSDVIFVVTPGIAVDVETPRTMLRGYASVPIELYARYGGEYDQVSPQADLLGRLTVVDQYFFVEGRASIQQYYYDPFGPRPDGTINATDNRYTYQSYRVTPVIQGQPTSTLRYELRDDNAWTTVGDSPTGGSEFSYLNHLSGFVERDPLPFGWRASIDRKVYRFEDQSRNQVLELARIAGTYRPSPAWEVFATGGYERNEFPLTSYSGAIYGGGFKWRPTDRTKLDAAAERRFFGTSYVVLFDHRTPRTVWNFSAVRDISSYPEQVAYLPPGTSVGATLDTILQNRIPDPTERAQFVENFIADRGLPSTLADPLSLYSQVLYLQQNLYGSVGLLGVRNAVFLNAFRFKSESISGTGETLPSQVAAIENNVQSGTSVVWSYALSGTSALAVSASYTRSEAIPPLEELSNQYGARFVLNRRLGPRTVSYVGARYQRFESDTEPDYRETAVFAGVNYSFR